MKRTSDEDESTCAKKRHVEVESQTLLELKDKVMEKVRNADQGYDAELEDAKHKYYVSYFRKTLEKLPCSKNILDSINIENNRDGFYKCFSIAKMCVNCEVEMKKYKSINMVINIFSSLLGKVIHTNFVLPYFSGIVKPEDLSNALLTYQSEIAKTDEPNELLCVAYLIQNELENETQLRIPNPMYDGLNKQISAISKYIVGIIKSITSKTENTAP